MEYLHYFNMLLAVPAILIQLLLLPILLLLILVKESKILSFIKKNFLLLGFIVSLVASLSSLFYSDVIGFVPCSLCWWQRIFMYPLVFIFGIGFLRKDKGVILYSLPLLISGILISIKHNFIYYFGEGVMPCDASGVSCVKKLVAEFGGYISIPMLALSAFFVILTLLTVAHFYKKE